MTRIGCLQFAPQVGDVANNLSRADAVLSKADQKELDKLDILVLPEMAFSGRTPNYFLRRLSMADSRRRLQLQIPR